MKSENSAVWERATNILDNLSALSQDQFSGHDPFDFLFCMRSLLKAFSPASGILSCSDAWDLADKILTAHKQDCQNYFLQEYVEAFIILLSKGTHVDRLSFLPRLDPEVMPKFLTELDIDNFEVLLGYAAGANQRFSLETFRAKEGFDRYLRMLAAIDKYAVEAYHSEKGPLLMVKWLKEKVGDLHTEEELIPIVCKIIESSVDDPVNSHYGDKVEAVAEILVHGFSGGYYLNCDIPADNGLAKKMLLDAPQQVFNTIIDEEIQTLLAPFTDEYTVTEDFQIRLDEADAFLKAFAE